MNMPQLRFNEFNSEWVGKTFDEILDITRLAGYEYSTYWHEDDNKEIIALRGYNIGKGKLNLINLGYISKELSLKLKRSRLSKGDVVYPCVGTIGNAVVIEEDDKYHIQQNLAKLTPKENISPYFISHFLMSDIGMNQVYRFNATSSQPNVLVGSLRNFEIQIPALPEQTKIANFLTAVDEKIHLLTQKCDLLAQYKKGVMQQIFSQELRFKDDDGLDFPEWEEAGFDELFFVANNKKTQIKSSDYLEQGNTPIVDQGQKHIVGYTNNTEIYKDVPVIIFGDHTRILKWIDFLFASGADGTQVLKSTNKLNLKFGYYALCHIELPNLGYSHHMKELKNLFIIIPTSIVEQTKIANFLTAIDEKITATQTQLQAVKQYKQGLLQQMFV